MDAVKRKKSAQETRSPGISVDRHAGSCHLLEECVDVDQRGVCCLSLLSDDLIKSCHLRLYSNNLSSGENAGVGDRSVLCSGKNKRNLRSAGRIDIVAGNNTEQTAKHGSRQTGLLRNFGQDK